MEETIVSPGVLAIENDQSFITTAQPIQAGAAIIGPTVKGKVGIPTLCTTYGEYLNKYGSTFYSGSQNYSYFTSIAAYNYFNNGGRSLLVTRVVSGSTIVDWTPATSSKIPTHIAETSASIEFYYDFGFGFSSAFDESFFPSQYEHLESIIINGVHIYYQGTPPTNSPTSLYINTGSFTSLTMTDYVVSTSIAINVSSSSDMYTSSLQYITASSVSHPNYGQPGEYLHLMATHPDGEVGNTYYIAADYTDQETILQYFTGGSNTECFVLETFNEGIIMNSTGPTGSYGTLLSGSAENYRWQIVPVSINDGTFNLIIRQGNDTNLSPSILENWGPLSLDPFASNYIEKVIGNQVETIVQDEDEYYVELIGSYPNQSNYIRVKSVLYPTPNYLDNNGFPEAQYENYLPKKRTGTFGDGKGTNIPSGIPGLYYDKITANNIQGLTANSYNEAVSLLSNKDAYKYNILIAPGLISSFGAPSTTVINNINTLVRERGDTMTIMDLVPYNTSLNTTIAESISYNTSYVATYWPWLKTVDPNLGTQVWVPASTMMIGVYAQNDNIAAPWFAPAGINRGVLENVVQAERFLTQGNRDKLYQANINPIATFPTTGVVVFGQKTLQKKKSALDRVNVRRLLIELKNYISQVADTFVFEQNDDNTRSALSSIINSYLATIQQQQGLSEFRLIMDSSNNPPAVVDQNQLIGQIYLKPIRSVEFILLDFNILPTGATFPG